MGVDQSRLPKDGEQYKWNTPDPKSKLGDVPAKLKSKFSNALLAQMKQNIGDLRSLSNILMNDTYAAQGKTIDSVKDEQGRNALHVAVQAQNTQAVKMLLEFGCQPRTLNSKWQSALHDAIRSGNQEIVLLLLEFGAPNVLLSTDARGDLPLHLAAQLFSQPHGDKIFWDILMCSGKEELNRMSPNGSSPLHIAASENYPKLAKILLNPNRLGPVAFPNISGTDGITPLHLAVSRGHKRVVQQLVDFGADPNATNFWGETPLHLAFQLSSDHCADIILEFDPLWRKGDSKRPFNEQPSSEKGKSSRKYSTVPSPSTSNEINQSGSSNTSPNGKSNHNHIKSQSTPNRASLTASGSTKHDNSKAQYGINAKDSNHLKLVVVEAKDFGKNLPLHYAAGWIPIHRVDPEANKKDSTQSKIADNMSSQVYQGSHLTQASSSAAPNSSASSSSAPSSTSSSSSVSSSSNKKGSLRQNTIPTNQNSPKKSRLNSPAAEPNSKSNEVQTNNDSNTYIESNRKKHKSRSSKDTNFSYAIKQRTVSIKLIERLLDLELRHSKNPLYRKYAFSIISPNHAGYTPLQIAKANNDQELIQLFEMYMPPAEEMPTEDSYLKIQLASDLHLECLNLDQPTGRKAAKKLIGRTDAKYLALLGDIGIAIRPYYRDFLIRLSKKFNYVFVLYGNHEYYHSTIQEADAVIDQLTKEYPNIINLKVGTKIEVEGVKIIGATLWSQILEDELEFVAEGMSDYRHIEIFEDKLSTGKPNTQANGNEAPTATKPTKRKITPQDTLKWHKEQLKFISKEIEASAKKNQQVVVMTHHAPLMRLGVSNPGLWDSAEISVASAFSTDLGGLFGNNVSAWLYGHTHWNHNMVVHDTIVAANQGGYMLKEPPELATNYDPKFVVKILKNVSQ